MLYLLISILGVLLTIFFVVGTHEFAHFIVARWLGVKVLRFSIGFGKVFYRWHDQSGTEYAFSVVPLGGYVKMLDSTEENVPPDQLPYAFNNQPYYKKFLIVLAGPLMNFLCAFFLYWIIFMVGFVTLKPIIGGVTPNSIAAAAGISKNQEIISIDQHPTSTWTSVLFRLLTHAGNKDHLEIKLRDLKNQQEKVHILDVSNWKLSSLNPDPLGSLGVSAYEPEIPLVIGVITPNSPAANSPFKVGDKIVAINQERVKDWLAVMTYITQHPNQTIQFTVERQNKKITFPVTIGDKRNFFIQQTGYLGIGPKFKWPEQLLHKIQLPALPALPRAFEEVRDFTYFNLLLFGKMLTGKISIESLGGPITIFESAGSALNYGFISFLGFLAFISISIGIINLIPIPGLDGGHLFIQTIEFIIRRPLPENITIFLYRLGFLTLFFLIFQALVNDILRLY